VQSTMQIEGIILIHACEPFRFIQQQHGNNNIIISSLEFEARTRAKENEKL
jgi:hypothetical protein